MNKNEHLLASRRFLPMFLTQFFGALNDNVFKQALLLVITYGWIQQQSANISTLNNLAALLFILPYFIFSATAGQIADKYERSQLIRYLKLLEIAIMLLGTVGFLMGNLWILLFALFLMGTSTCVIAFLPSYDRIGVAAIVILSLMRIGQGVAQGGSWDGLPSLLALSAPENKRGFYAMLGQLAAPVGFLIAAGLFAYLLANLSQDDFLVWGWRFPFFCAFAINIVALFARLRLVSTSEYSRLLDAHELDPAPVGELVKSQGSNIAIGALAALASYALFHLVTVFPLSWIQLYDTRPMDEFLVIQMWGAGLAVLAIFASGFIADRAGRRTTLGTLAVLIGLFSLAVPSLMDGGVTGQNTFILVGFTLLGLSYGQAAGAVTANFKQQYRYTGAALTSDLAWLVGAAFAPLVALGLSAHFGLGYVSLYLLSGAVGSLAALSLNRALEIRD